MLPFLYNVWKSWRHGEVVTTDDPWKFGNSLEWATSCPPPRHNFLVLPRIRSERPAFDLHYPHFAEKVYAEKYVGPFAHKESPPPAPSEVLAAAVEPEEITKGDPKNPN